MKIPVYHYRANHNFNWHNAVKCNECGDIISSKHHYDYVNCSCFSTAVDGGFDCLKRKGSDYTELSF